jgi:hypothetical protein
MLSWGPKFGAPLSKFLGSWGLTSEECPRSCSKHLLTRLSWYFAEKTYRRPCQRGSQPLATWDPSQAKVAVYGSCNGVMSVYACQDFSSLPHRPGYSSAFVSLGKLSSVKGSSSIRWSLRFRALQHQTKQYNSHRRTKLVSFSPNLNRSEIFI